MSLEEAPLGSPLKTSLIEILAVFCKFKGGILVRQNQIEIISQLASDNSRSNMLSYFTEEGFDELSHLIEKTNEIEVVDDSVASDIEIASATLHVSLEVFNLIKCLDLLGLCCEGKSDMAELKCQKDILTLTSAARILFAC